MLISGNPEIGTPPMQADPCAALDLPLRVLIWQQDGNTNVGYLSVDTLAVRENFYELLNDGVVAVP